MKLNRRKLTDQDQGSERSRERLFALIEKSWERNNHVPAEEIEREIEAAIREVRGQTQVGWKRVKGSID